MGFPGISGCVEVQGHDLHSVSEDEAAPIEELESSPDWRCSPHERHGGSCMETAEMEGKIVFFSSLSRSLYGRPGVRAGRAANVYLDGSTSLLMAVDVFPFSRENGSETRPIF